MNGGRADASIEDEFDDFEDDEYVDDEFDVEEESGSNYVSTNP